MEEQEPHSTEEQKDVTKKEIRKYLPQAMSEPLERTSISFFKNMFILNTGGLVTIAGYSLKQGGWGALRPWSALLFLSGIIIVLLAQYLFMISFALIADPYRDSKLKQVALQATKEVLNDKPRLGNKVPSTATCIIWIAGAQILFFTLAVITGMIGCS